MIKGFDPHTPYFHSVALALIIGGAFIFALGGIEWIFNIFGDSSFAWPMMKVMGGMVITALGYIHLELELIRISRK